MAVLPGEAVVPPGVDKTVLDAPAVVAGPTGHRKYKNKDKILLEGVLEYPVVPPTVEALVPRLEVPAELLHSVDPPVVPPVNEEVVPDGVETSVDPGVGVVPPENHLFSSSTQ